MLSELLLVLAGHPSAFFTPSPPAAPMTLALSPSLTALLHPGEAVALSSLAHLAFNYSRVRTWAASVQSRGRRVVLEDAVTSKGKGRESSEPGVYLVTLASSILDVFGGYDLLLVETEARVLRLDPGVVQDAHGYVPLSTLLATFDAWQAPLASLAALVDTLEAGVAWTPGRILHELHARTQTGHPRLHEIYAALLADLERLFLTHLTAFLLSGLAPVTSTPINPAVGLDTGPDPLSPRHRAYALNAHMFPPSVSARTRESVLYVGRVAATLKREGRNLPRHLVETAREEVMAVRGLDETGGLDEAVQRARAEVGEWLWKHILTGSQIVEAIDTFGNYFLTRNAEYALSVLRELGRLRDVKLLTNPSSSASVIREQDVNLALLRASVGTAAEADRSLERLRWKMPRGPLRAVGGRPGAHADVGAGAGAATDDVATSPIRALFSAQVLGTPLELTTTVSWPLDLFMTPPAVGAYADMHAYLFALRDTHARVLACWTRLSASQRRRRKYTGASEGGTRTEAAQRTALARHAWAVVHAMLFWLDQVQTHFMTDIIDVQHRRLLEQLDAVAPAHAHAHAPHSLRSSASAAALANSARRHRASSPAPAPAYPPAAAPTSRRASLAATPVSPRTPSSAAFDAQTVHTAPTAHSARSRLAGPPPTPTRSGLASAGAGPHAGYLDFLTLRHVHARHLALLRDGLLLADVHTATAVRDVLAVCTRFAGLVERWGGDVVPELLTEGDAAAILTERAQAVAEIDETLRDLLADFFRALIESQNPAPAAPAPADPSSSASASADDAVGHASSASLSASLSRARAAGRSTRNASYARALSTSFRRSASGTANPGPMAGAGAARARAAEDRALEADAVMGRHIEQHFNGVLSQWMEAEPAGTAGQSVLAQGGLA